MQNIHTQITSFLIEKGWVKKEVLEKVAIPSQDPENFPVLEEFVHSGILTEEQFSLALEEFFGVPFTKKDDYPQEALLINHSTNIASLGKLPCQRGNLPDYIFIPFSILCRINNLLIWHPYGGL